MIKKYKSSNCPLCGQQANYDFTGQDFMFDRSKLYRYSKCTRCEISFQDPMPNLKTINSFYPDTYENYNDAKTIKLSYLEKVRLHYHHGYKNIIKTNLLNSLISKFLLFDHTIINNHPQGKFLDIGCGNGSRMMKMKHLGWSVFGVELNSFAYKKCKKNKLNVQNTSLEKADFQNHLFDVIYMSHLIEHLHNPCEVIKICESLLKKGGKLYINTPNLKALGRLFFGKYWFANEVPRHLILYSYEGIKSLIKNTDFEITYSSFKTTPKIVLNSIDYFFNLKKPSKRNKLFRFFSKIYIFSAFVLNAGDESFYIIKKR